MNEHGQITQQIRMVFEGMNLEVPLATTDLFKAGVLDSMTFVQLLLQLEQQLGVTFSFDQLEPNNFRSIERIAALVAAQTPRRASLA